MHDEELPTIDEGADGYVICSNCGSHEFEFDTFCDLILYSTRMCSLCGKPKPFPKEEPQ